MAYQAPPFRDERDRIRRWVRGESIALGDHQLAKAFFLREHPGEVTLVRRTKSVHWKYTNSTTLTFATRYEVLRQDLDILNKHCGDGKSHDFQLFCELLQQRGRSLVSPMPGYSTHLHIPWITPEVIPAFGQ
jgi:hypothetical protein